MQTLTRSQLKRLDDFWFPVFYRGKGYAFVRKYNKYAPIFKARFPFYVLVKVKD